MENRCSVKKGIFRVLRCPHEAYKMCVTCGKAMCDAHARGEVCVVCASECGSQNPQHELDKWQEERNFDYDRWYFATRDYYYRTSSYRPFVGFTNHDYASFDNVGGWEANPEEQDPSFMDS